MDEELQSALNQVAVEQLRADEAEKKLKEEKTRADSAEGERDAALEKIKVLEKQRTDAANVNVDQIQRQNKVLTAQVGDLKKRLDAATSEENVRKLVADRISIETRARAILGDEERFDSLSDVQLMTKVVESLHNIKVEGKSPDYVRARFDASVEAYSMGSKALDRVNEIARDNQEKNKPENRADAASARQKFLKEQDEMWKQSFSKKEVA